MFRKFERSLPAAVPPWSAMPVLHESRAGLRRAGRRPSAVVRALLFEANPSSVFPGGGR